MAEPVTVELRSNVTLATIMARKAVSADQLGDALGCPLPEGPSIASNGALTLVGTGPGVWLALGDGREDFAAAGLARRLAGLAAVSDQSSGYTIFRLSGPGARTLLQRGVSIDLHPSAFSAGSAATTVIAHIGVNLWQIDDLPIYEVAVFRSLSTSFRHWTDAGVEGL